MYKVGTKTIILLLRYCRSQALYLFFAQHEPCSTKKCGLFRQTSSGRSFAAFAPFAFGRFDYLLPQSVLFLFFSVIVYTLWWHKARFGEPWENIWGLILLLILAYICLSFSIQVLRLIGLLARRELHYLLVLPRVLAPAALHLQQQDPSELLLELTLPNILFGIQVFWKIQLRDAQTGHKIRLCYRLRSGQNQIRLPLQVSALEGKNTELAAQYKNLFSQLRRGLYYAEHQCFFVRDCFSCLKLHYRIAQHREIAVLSSGSLALPNFALPASPTPEPLSTAIDKFATESFHEQRPYYPGDDPRRINWKVYSRFNELYVRIPEEQNIYSEDLHCYFAPDMACYPAYLRSSALDFAAAYYLHHLKELHRRGYRIFVHIPDILQENPSRGHRESGLHYEAANEEAIFRALAAYPQNASLKPAQTPGKISGKTGQTHQKAGKTQRSQMLENLPKTMHTNGAANCIVFASPHSDIQRDFPAATFIPLPEPSRALQEELCTRPLFRLLPIRLLWRWIFQSRGMQRFPAGSPAFRLCQKLGIAMLPVSTDAPSVGRRSLTPLETCSYPRLLWLLWAWRRYYRQPEKRYATHKTGQTRIFRILDIFR